MRFLFAFGFIGGVIAAADLQGGPAKKRPPKFTIGKDTTFVTGPVDKDGYIDYLAALNEVLGKDITPDKNAAVLLAKAFKTHRDGGPGTTQFFGLLGVPTPSAKQEYFVDLQSYLAAHLKVNPDKLYEAADAQLNWTRQRPWKAKEYPLIAECLKNNVKPLEQVVLASALPRYYFPLVAVLKNGKERDLLMGVNYFDFECRGAADALISRAMLHLGEGRYDAAWQDLLACHRLGRLVAHGGTWMANVAGISIDITASEADLAFLERAKLDAKQVMKCLEDLQKLQPLPGPADAAHLGERFLFLEAVMEVEKNGIDYLENFLALSEKNLLAVVKRNAATINWDGVLQGVNRQFDRVVTALRIKERKERTKQLEQIAKEIQDAQVKMADRKALASVFEGPGATQETRDKAIVVLMVDLLFVNPPKMQGPNDRHEQKQANLHVAFALGAFQREHGKYPTTLEELAPKYLASIPPDLYTGKALTYRPTADGYLLYSFGVNGRDDQGRGYEDDPPADDLSVRMPLPALAGK